MDRHNVARTNNIGERVASIYADTYFRDKYDDQEPVKDEPEPTKVQLDTLSEESEWKSPSDLLIGILELTPPFTSKITRGITHEGILAIGSGVLDKERGRFNQYMEKLLRDNEIVWNQILEHQKIIVEQKVEEMYKEILANKSKTLMNEIYTFYENTLQDLENHMQKEVSNVLNSTHAKIISDLNIEIKEKLEKERKILEKVLEKNYNDEVKKIKHYYSLLLGNEDKKFNKAINAAIFSRNDALKAFYRQIEAENLARTMYVMCTERKKCRIKQFILDTYHSADMAEKLKTLKEKEELLEAYRSRDRRTSEINKEWEEKIKKILLLFLKFISFSLKLLPDQTTFLLDLEKMVVLQLNEMQKSPTMTSSILVDDDELNNFEFVEPDKPGPVCDKDPFVIVGDTSDSIPSPHGSRETLDSRVPLPTIRVQRQFLYAKCDKHAEVKALLEAKRCKCRDPQKVPTPPPKEPTPEETKLPTPEIEPSFEHLGMDDIEILKECPLRQCHNWTKDQYFPYMNNYLNFNEDNYKRVKAILDIPQANIDKTPLLNPKDFIFQELPFAKTLEKTHNVATQYSSQEDLSEGNLVCRCSDDSVYKIRNQPSVTEVSMGKEIEKIMKKRRDSLQRVIHSNPNLLKMFTDEDFDFIYHIKI